MDAIADMMEKGIQDNVFPGAVLFVSVDSKILFHRAFGRSDIYSNEMMSNETIFDLASLTKPLATAMAVLKLIQDGSLRLDQTIGDVLNSVFNSSSFNLPKALINVHDSISAFICEKGVITIEELLRHTSGLPAHRLYYKQLIKYPLILRRNCLRALLIKEPLVHKPGEKEVYSDLGYILLAWIVEIFSKQRIDNFLREQVYLPLGIDDLFFIDLLDSVYPYGNPMVSTYERTSSDISLRSETFGKKFAATENCPWRKKLIKGEVHDDNAWAAGGIEGHAGLFGTASAVSVLLGELMNGLQRRKTKIISSNLLKRFVIKKNRGDRVAGFDTPSKPVSSSGRYFSASSIGHLGFTGTSFWIDPEKSVIVVLLTNRIHPSRKNEKIRRFRPLIHDLVMEQFLL